MVFVAALAHPRWCRAIIAIGNTTSEVTFILLAVFAVVFGSRKVDQDVGETLFWLYDGAVGVQTG